MGMRFSTSSAVSLKSSRVMFVPMLPSKTFDSTRSSPVGNVDVWRSAGWLKPIAAPAPIESVTRE
jgi:hypothetical protein